MTLILLRLSNGSRVDRPRDLPGYDGRGASKALDIAAWRAYRVSGQSDRASTLHELYCTQAGREAIERVARESEAAE